MKNAKRRIRVVRHLEPESFAVAVLPLLIDDQAANTLPLSVLQAMLTRPKTFPERHLFTVESDGETCGMAWLTPPHPFAVYHVVEEAQHSLARAAAEFGVTFKHIHGPRPCVDRFAAAWLSRRSGRVRDVMEQQLMQLAAVCASTVPGRVRRAKNDDLPVLNRWVAGFVDEVGVPTDVAGVHASVIKSVGSNSLLIWELHGEPVSMAIGGGGRMAHARITLVYTPPEFRGKRYAQAVVAALSQQLLDAGCRSCVLFVDCANQAASAAYRRIGYRPLGNYAMLTLQDGLPTEAGWGQVGGLH